MGFDQKGSLVFLVSRGETGQWLVAEEGLEKPLALFDTAKDAREYARNLAKTKEGSKVKIFDENGTHTIE